MSGDGFGLPNVFWNNNQEDWTTEQMRQPLENMERNTQASGSIGEVRKPHEHMGSNTQASWSNDAVKTSGSKNKGTTTKRSKLTARKSVAPVRKSNRVLNQVRRNSISTVSFMDLTDEEELPT